MKYSVKKIITSIIPFFAHHQSLTMQVFIPMSGIGSRFRSRGYEKPKYLLDCGNGKSVLKNQIDTLPSNVPITLILNHEDFRDSSIVSELVLLSPHIRLLEIEKHKHGPVHTILAAERFLNLNTEIIVSYCDYAITWDHTKLLANARNQNANCSVATYRGYHPHHKRDGDRYGYCRIKGDSMRAIEYREKESFSEDPDQECASCGLYYFRSGIEFIEYSKTLANSNIRIKGEMYISMVIQLMMSNGLKVVVEDIHYMFQFGTPDDYEEAKYYIESITRFYRNRKENTDVKITIPCLLPMAGLGSRFKLKGFSTPKQFLPVFDNVACKIAIEDLADGELLIGTLTALAPEVDKLFGDRATITSIDSVLNGQALTCEKILENNIITGPFIVTACDSTLVLDKRKLGESINHSDWDILVVSCKSSPQTKGNENAYSWLIYDKSLNIRKVYCKSYPGNLELEDVERLGHIDGTFVFKNKLIFSDLLEELKKTGVDTSLGEFYVDQLVEIALEKAYNVRAFEATHYICYGTPEEYYKLCYYYNALIANGGIMK